MGANGGSEGGFGGDIAGFGGLVSGFGGAALWSSVFVYGDWDGCRDDGGTDLRRQLTMVDMGEGWRQRGSVIGSGKGQRGDFLENRKPCPPAEGRYKIATYPAHGAERPQVRLWRIRLRREPVEPRARPSTRHRRNRQGWTQGPTAGSHQRRTFSRTSG